MRSGLPYSEFSRSAQAKKWAAAQSLEKVLPSSHGGNPGLGQKGGIGLFEIDDVFFRIGAHAPSLVSFGFLEPAARSSPAGDLQLGRLRPLRRRISYKTRAADIGTRGGGPPWAIARKSRGRCVRPMPRASGAISTRSAASLRRMRASRWPARTRARSRARGRGRGISAPARRHDQDLRAARVHHRGHADRRMRPRCSGMPRCAPASPVRPSRPTCST